MSWLDNWAKSSARPAQTGGDGMSRRQMLKRAGIVAGVAWTAPLIQSATAPAYAYNTCTTNCANGFPCTSPGQCASGICTNGYCSASAGWPGDACSGNGGNKCHGFDTDGLVSCRNGVCPTIAAGGPCRSSADCVSGVICAANHVCGGSGATCTNNAQCAPGKTCSGGVCVP